MAGLTGGEKRLQLGRWALLLVLAVAAGVLRSLPWRNFLGPSGEYLFYGPDSYDHLRRITLGLGSFPRVPTFDSFYGYPVGTGQIWSPLFDYLLTVATLLAGGGHATAHAIGFWLSPLLAGATILLTYRFASRLFSRSAGLVAAAILVLLPGHILYSFVAELDHHVAEPMVCLALFLSLLRWGELPAATPLLPGWLRTGCWFVIAILVWRGSVLFWGAAWLALALQLWGDRLQPAVMRGRAHYAAALSLVTALLLVPLCAFNVWGSSAGVSFGIVSWFHVALAFGAAVLFLLLPRLAAAGRRSLAITALLAGGGVGGLLLIPAVRAVVRQLAAGVAVIGGHDPWLDSISELRPMLFPQGTFDLRHATETLSLIYWLLPPLLVIALRRWRSGGWREFRLAVFLVFGALFWLIPLFRERYVHLAAVAVALAGGFLTDLVRARWDERHRRAVCVGGAVLLGVLLAPIGPFLRQLPDVGLEVRERVDLPLALAWLRDNTPTPAGFAQPLTPPAYGVLADWGLGADLCYRAQRATVATNFGWETHGLFASAAFLTLTEPRQAAAIVRANRVRYLVLDDVTPELPRLRAIAEAGLRRGRGGIATLPPFVPLATMYYRLYIQDGSAYTLGEVTAAALGGYRLIYESPGGTLDPVVGMVSHYKIFEVVSGALLAGRTLPGEPVAIALQLRTPAGRLLLWQDRVTAGGDGSFAFRLPYASDRANGALVPLGPYRLTVRQTVQPVAVSAADILAGRTLQLR